MKFTDLLTIAMPCYERKEFFQMALESALNQTIKCKVIVIDNCSSHNFFEQVCKKKDIPYYRNESNIGIKGNFSRGFELAKTKYVLNLQDDDILHPEYVESFVKSVNKYPDIDIFFTDFILITPKGEKPHHHVLPFGYIANGNKIIEYGIKYKLGFPYMASAIRKEKGHKSSEIKDFVGSYDWEWMYSVADQLSFYGDKRKLYKYRRHDNQTTYNDAPQFLMSLPYIYDNILGEKVSDEHLKRKISRDSFETLVAIKSHIHIKELKEIIREDNKYGRHFANKLKENLLWKIIFVMPKWLVKLIYKFFLKH